MTKFIDKKESENLEFKKSVGEWKEIVETVAAFSNTSGGRIIVGVSKSGNIVGMEIGKNTIEDLTNKIVTNTDPKIYPKIAAEKIGEKNVIIIEVNESTDKLVLAFGRPFKRVGKSTIKMSKDEYETSILEKHKEKLRFDNQICEDTRLGDIDEEEIKLFLKKAKTERGLNIELDLSLKEILMRLKLIKDSKLTNSAILLFGKNPQSFFIQAEVKCVRFKGTGVTGTMIDMKDIGSNLIDQVIEVEKFIFSHISLTSWIENGKIERQEKWEYPPKAIREALVNAIAHRDYRSPSKVQVRIFDDRIEFWNPGKLPEGWTVETLKEKHESKPFNPLIARAFFWIKYIEEVGTGTNKIIDWCKEWGLPEPDFEYTGTNIVTTFRKSKLTREYLENLGLNERELKIIEHIKVNNRITSSAIQKMFNVRRKAANSYLKKLIDLGLIARKGAGKMIYYVFKIG
jgi:ATP-dependent DNA helicase RecG